MTGAFAAMVDALFADPNLAEMADYRPLASPARPVRAIARRADAVEGFGAGRIWSETTRVDLRVSEVAAPRPGDRLVLGGELLEVQGEPVRDRARLVWTLELRPVVEEAPEPATAPAMFVPHAWTLADAPSVGGDRLALAILELPDDGGAEITMLEWRIGGGAAQALADAGLGLREITVLAAAEAVVSIRAVNAIGAGPWSAAKAATPTMLAPPPPAWPEGAVAVWLIVGQSNADGYGPYAQDPARLDVAAAIPALSDAERQTHDWIRFTPPTVEADETSPGSITGGQFTRRGLAIAGVGMARTASKMWSGGAFGIPDATPSFGPEVGLVRYVLEDPTAAHWRDDAAPRLRVLKAVRGGTGVDAFRHGGAAEGFARGAIMTTTGTATLTGLAAAGGVLLQGIVCAIGEADANLAHPDGSGAKMTSSFAPRMAEWLRQLRAVLGSDLPVALVEVFENGADRVAINAQLAALAVAIPNATVIPSAGLQTVGDATHYDGPAQAAIGAAAFGWLRAAHGRPGDGLVTAHPFAGFAPALLTPPMWSLEGGTEMGIAGHATAAGVLHGLVLARGAAAPTAAEVAAGADVPGRFAAFHRDVAAGAFDVLTGEGSFAAGVALDCWMTFEASDGDGPTDQLTPLFHLVRAPSVAFAVPPAIPLPAPGGGATFAWTAAAPGTDSWAIWPGDVPFRRPEDVEFGAFQPVAWGRIADHGPDHAASVAIAGLTPGATHTLQVALRRAADAHPDAGALGETRRVAFTAL